MKTCSRCGRQIEETNSDPGNPIEALGDLFRKSVSPDHDSDLCQACKEERGMFSLIGFYE